VDDSFAAISDLHQIDSQTAKDAGVVFCECDRFFNFSIASPPFVRRAASQTRNWLG